MAEESAKLRIPYIAAAQAQKHVTHNEGMTLLDTLVQLSVLDKDLTGPPGSPAESDTYIVATGATGAWTGWDKRIARFIDGTWRSFLPGQGDGAGWLAYVIDESTLYVFTGAEWEQLFVAGGAPGAGAVDSVNGETGAVSLEAEDIPFVSAGLNYTDADDVQESLEDYDAALGGMAALAGRASGQTLIGGTGAADALRLRATAGAGAGSETVIIQAGNNGATEVGRFLASGALFGFPSALSFFNEVNGSITPAHQFNTQAGTMAITRFSSSGFSGRVVFAKSKTDTVGSHAIVGSGDPLGLFLFAGSDGTNFRTAAAFGAYVDGTPGSSDMPGRLVFSTTADGAASVSESMRIANGGNVYVPRVGTTASAANAFLNSGSTPANELLRSTSSIAFKKDIEDLAPAYADKALELRPVWYRSKAKADNPDWSWYGFIAEEVAAVDPRLVHWGYGDDDWEEVGVYDTAESETEPQLVRLERRLKQGAELKPQGVMYERLVPHLVTVIKRLRRGSRR